MRPMAFCFLIRPLAAYLLDPAGSDYSLPRLAAQYLAAPLTARSGAAGGGDLASAGPAAGAACRPGDAGPTFCSWSCPCAGSWRRWSGSASRWTRRRWWPFGQMLQGEIDRSSDEVYRYAGEEFNINSPKKLGQILFEQLELPHGKRRRPATRPTREVLEKLKGKHLLSRKSSAIGC